MNSSCGSWARKAMARSIFLRFAFFSSLSIIFFFTCNSKGGNIKQQKVKIKSSQGAQEKVEMERKIGGNQRIIQGSEPRGGGGGG